MSSTDQRGAILRAFDAHAREFARDCAAHYEAGERLAAQDIARLARFAERVVEDLDAWGRAIRELDVACAAPFAPREATRLLAESVFDGVLAPGAAPLFDAALDLAWGAQ
jgi:hypothetical protein